jgi:hypothetical protein
MAKRNNIFGKLYVFYIKKKKVNYMVSILESAYYLNINVIYI